MAQPEATRVPTNIIETVNKVVRTSYQMLPEIGREPTTEELAEKLAIPLDTVHKVLAIAKRPIRLKPEISDKENPISADLAAQQRCCHTDLVSAERSG